MEKRRRIGPVTRLMMQKKTAEDTEQASTIFQEQILPNSLLTDFILNFLPLSDILSCSLASKAWNTLTREYLRRSRRHCLMRINIFDGSQQELEDRVKVLKRGIRNHNREYTGYYYLIDGAVDKFVVDPATKKFVRNAFVLSRIRVKRVVFGFEGPTIPVELDVNALRISLTILPVGDIESIKICTDLLNNWNDVFRGFGGQEFRNVKIIESDCSATCDCLSETYEDILRTCPNLSKLYVPVGIESVDVFREFGKLSVITYLRVNLGHELSLGSEDMRIIEEGNFALEIFDVRRFVVREPEQFQCISRILQQHSKSLRMFTLMAGYEEITQIQIPPMPLVKQVIVTCCIDPPGPLDNDEILREHPHLKQIFPNAAINSLHNDPHIFPQGIHGLGCTVA